MRGNAFYNIKKISNMFILLGKVFGRNFDNEMLMTNVRSIREMDEI